jgi:hypothetical protein
MRIRIPSANRFTPLLAAALAVTATSTEALASEIHRYKVQSGMVEYELDGAWTGTESLFFDRWGMREAKTTQATIQAMGTSVKRNQLTLMDGEWTYIADLDAKTGTKMATPQLKELIESARKEGKDLTDLGEEAYARMGGKKVGQETMIGKPCDVWSIESLGTKVWVWQGVPLKTEVDMMGQRLVSTAIKIDEKAEVAEERFALPAGVKFVEGENPMEMMRRYQGGQGK